MFPLYFMILFWVYQDDSFGTQSFVNTQYVEKGECEMYIEDTKNLMKDHNSDIKDIYGWCVREDWPFPPPAQPKGSI